MRKGRQMIMAFLALLVLAGAGIGYAEEDAYTVIMDGIPMDAAIQGRLLGDAEYNILYVPLRPVAEAGGFTVNWLPQSGAVSIANGNSARSYIPQTNAPECWCAEPPMLIEGRVWISGSFAAREFGMMLDVQEHTIALQSGKIRWVDAPTGSYGLILDVRNPEEYAAGHLEGALLIPVTQLSERVQELETYRNDPLLVYCKKGSRSVQAAVLLRKHGFENICILKDGYDGWIAANTH